MLINLAYYFISIFINELSFFDLTYERITARMNEAKAIYTDVLAEPFDYNQEESFDADYDNIEFAKTPEELKDRWRKQLKLQALSSIVDKQKLEQDKKEKDASYEMKSFELIEKEPKLGYL